MSTSVPAAGLPRASSSWPAPIRLLAPPRLPPARSWSAARRPGGRRCFGRRTKRRYARPGNGHAHARRHAPDQWHDHRLGRKYHGLALRPSQRLRHRRAFGSREPCQVHNRHSDSKLFEHVYRDDDPQRRLADGHGHGRRRPGQRNRRPPPTRRTWSSMAARWSMPMTAAASSNRLFTLTQNGGSISVTQNGALT